MHVLDIAQDTDQIQDIMSVHRTEIADIHTLKHVVLMGELYLDMVVPAYYVTTALLRKESQRVKHTGYVVAELVV